MIQISATDQIVLPLQGINVAISTTATSCSHNRPSSRTARQQRTGCIAARFSLRRFVTHVLRSLACPRGRYSAPAVSCQTVSGRTRKKPEATKPCFVSCSRQLFLSKPGRDPSHSGAQPSAGADVLHDIFPDGRRYQLATAVAFEWLQLSGQRFLSSSQGDERRRDCNHPCSARSHSAAPPAAAALAALSGRIPGSLIGITLAVTIVQGTVDLHYMMIRVSGRLSSASILMICRATFLLVGAIVGAKLHGTAEAALVGMLAGHGLGLALGSPGSTDLVETGTPRLPKSRTCPPLPAMGCWRRVCWWCTWPAPILNSGSS